MHITLALLCQQVFLLGDDVAEAAKPEVAWSTFGAAPAAAPGTLYLP